MQKVRLVFDTGAAQTQIHTGFIESIGYSAKHAIRTISVQGAAGDPQPGYLLQIQRLTVFGLSFDNLTVGAFDFDQFDAYQIDGLLGFDVIKQLHLEMIGPKGELRIF